MRLKITLLAAVLAVAVSAVALAAGTTAEITTTMGGTARLAAGGKLTLTTTQAPKRRFRVAIHYNVAVKSKTVLAFAAYPCRSTKCDGASRSTITLGAGQRRISFNGRVPMVQASSGGKVSKFACVYAQLRDQGPRGRAPGKVVKRGKLAGVQLCQDVSKK
jgi:hypothetical protein